MLGEDIDGEVFEFIHVIAWDITRTYFQVIVFHLDIPPHTVP